MINEADAVVIGSGSLGSSTAFYLSKSGKKVALVDKLGFTSQTSPRAAGMAMQIQIDDVLAEIAIGSIKKPSPSRTRPARTCWCMCPAASNMRAPRRTLRRSMLKSSAESSWSRST